MPEYKENPTAATRDKKPKIYILPALEVRDTSQLKILIQTDGNTRAKGLNQGYDDGGQNVIKIAHYLAQRGDVSTMVACIMSSDNADKRSEEFFMKMYNLSRLRYHTFFSAN